MLSARTFARTATRSAIAANVTRSIPRIVSIIDCNIGGSQLGWNFRRT